MAVKARATVTLARVNDGAAGVGVSKTEVYYYLSTSNTTQSGGSWVTTPPAWVDGRYYWQKIKTTFTNGQTSESQPVCITGGKGATGTAGAAGKGVSSISTQFYLSTSKTAQSGGSWTDVMPTWESGKYLWTRSKIVYTNPSSTVYTAPICDSSWDAINDIQVGGRNLLRNSSFNLNFNNSWKANLASGSYSIVDGYSKQKGIKITRTGYSGSSRVFIQNDVSNIPDFKKGDVYTLSAWVRIDTKFDVNIPVDIFCRSAYGSTSMFDHPDINVKTSEATVGTWKYYKTTYTFTNDVDEYSYFGIAISGNGACTISCIKLEEGNIATAWTPAPEDASDFQIGGRNLLRDTDAPSLTKISGPADRRFSAEIDGTNEVASYIEVSDSPCSSKYGVQIEVKTANGQDSGCWLVFYNRTIAKPMDITFEVGEEYTLSCYIRSISGNPEHHMGIFNRTTYGGYFPVTTEWKRYSDTFIATESMNTEENAWAVFGCNANAVGVIQLTGFKLEKGSKPTDWSPAPEDMATSEEVQNAQDAADDANQKADATENRVTVAESAIAQLNNAISMLITDENGNSMMTQASDGWRFDMSDISANINQAIEQLNKLSGSVDGIDNTIEQLNSLINELGTKTAYIVMTTDDSGSPCIELGKSDNDFKVRITNTSVDFMDGSSRVAYVSNQALYIEKAIIKDELQIGEGSGFVWKRRANGNMGLRWVD